MLPTPKLLACAPWQNSKLEMMMIVDPKLKLATIRTTICMNLNGWLIAKNRYMALLSYTIYRQAHGTMD